MKRIFRTKNSGRALKRMGSLVLTACMLFQLMGISAYANRITVSSGDEIFISGGNAIYPAVAMREVVGTYAVDDERTVDVCRVNTQVYANTNLDNADITIKVTAPESGTYSMEAVMSKIDAVPKTDYYSPYDVTLNGVKLDIPSGEQITVTGSATKVFYQYNFTGLNLVKGENTIVMHPTAKAGNNKYTFGLGYLKLTKNEEGTITINYDDEKTMHADFYAGETITTYPTADDASAATNGITVRQFRMYANREYSENAYYVHYPFSVAKDGYYDLTVYSNGHSSYYSDYKISVDETLLHEVNSGDTKFEKIFYQDANTQDGRIGKFSLGEVYLTAGPHTLKFTDIAKRASGSTTATNTFHRFYFKNADLEYKGYVSIGRDARTDMHASLYADNEGNSKVTLADGTTAQARMYRLRSSAADWESANLYVDYGFNVPVAGDYTLSVWANNYVSGDDNSGYTLKLDGEEILGQGKSQAGTSLEATGKMMKYDINLKNLSAGDHTLRFDGIQARTNSSELAIAAKHRFYFWKGAIELADLTEYKLEAKDIYAVCANDSTAITEEGNAKVYATGTLIDRTNEGGEYFVALVEYAADGTLLNFASATATAEAVTGARTVGFDVFAGDFEVTIAADNSVKFTNNVKLFVWKDMKPCILGEDIIIK